MKKTLWISKACFSVLWVLTLQSCISTDSETFPTPSPSPYLHDSLFFAGDKGPDVVAEAFLELPDRYKEELDRLIAPLSNERDRYLALRSWMFTRFEDYEFDVTETVSIGELATRRKVNCLSFSAMFVAAARYVDVSASFQLVFAPPYWDSENGTWINNQHINVTGLIPKVFSEERDRTYIVEGDTSYRDNGMGVNVVWRMTAVPSHNSDSIRYTMDISPAIVSMPMARRIIDDQQVLSLYYSNKAVEYLLNSDLAQAYAYSREALFSDARSTVAWNNLGVLYSRKGDLDRAAAAYQMAINLKDDAHSARSNLAGVYRRQGKIEQAEALELSVAEVVQQNPYYYQSLADKAFKEGDYELAILRLDEAVELKHNELLFYHELAMAHQKLGHQTNVLENLASARRHSKGADRARFSGKIKALEQLYAAQAGN